MALNKREKLLVGILAAFLAVIALFAGLRGMAGLQDGIAEQLEADRRTLIQVQGLDAELARLERSKRTRGLEGSLIGYMEQLTDRAGLKARVQLNPITQAAGAKVQAIDLKVDQMTLDETLRLLYTIENAEFILVLDQVEISPSFKDKDLLRLTLRVLAQT
jgi:hypothetical protein